MSENRLRRAFHTTRIKVTAEKLPSKEQRAALEELYMTLEASKTDAVAAERASEIALAKAKAQRARAAIAEVEILQRAADNFTQVASEKFWFVYKDKDGDIVFEGFTDRLLRNNMRAQQDMIGERLAGGSDDDSGHNDMYEPDDDESNDKEK